MNKVVLMGRLVKDPEVQQSNETAVGRYTLAVDRRNKRDGEQNADFISIVVFNKSAEFAEKYFHKGMKVIISGRIATDSYTNKDGVKIYTTKVIADEQEFCERKNGPGNANNTADQDFMDIPNGIEDELPFST